MYNTCIWQMSSMPLSDLHLLIDTSYRHPGILMDIFAYVCIWVFARMPIR